MMELRQTDTIVAWYAKLPVISAAHRYLVHIKEPYDGCALEKVIKFEDYLKFEILPDYTKVKEKDWNGPFPYDPTTERDWDAIGLETLKRLILEEWKDLVETGLDWTDWNLADWMPKVNKVKLIECTLLVPKDENNSARP